VLAVDRDTKTTLDEWQADRDRQPDRHDDRTIKLKATFPNEKMQLWPGQFANARPRAAVRKDATVVPASVVQRGPQGSSRLSSRRATPWKSARSSRDRSSRARR